MFPEKKMEHHTKLNLPQVIAIDIFGDMADILNFIVSSRYYGMLRGEIHTNLCPEHPIIAI